MGILMDEIVFEHSQREQEMRKLAQLPSWNELLERVLEEKRFTCKDYTFGDVTISASSPEEAVAIASRRYLLNTELDVDSDLFGMSFFDGMYASLELSDYQYLLRYLGLLIEDYIPQN
jgi:hypothetical protein